MKKLATLLSLSALLCTSASKISAATTVVNLTFEAAETTWFSFAQNGANVSTIQSIAGAGGTDGIATRVLADPGSFAGGGIGSATNPINLSVAGIVGGSFTVAQFDNIVFGFDVNVPVGQSVGIRLEAGNGGFNERVDFGNIAGTGAFQAISFNASTGLAAQKTTLVNFMNTASATGLKFVYAINNQSTVPANTDFVFDNLLVTYVPEPSSAMVLTLVGLTGLLRRRRH